MHRIPAACLLLLTVGWSAEEKARLHPVPDSDKNAKTGPAVASKIPPFATVDQFGKRQTFDSLRGPKGLALLFIRSADW